MGRRECSADESFHDAGGLGERGAQVAAQQLPDVDIGGRIQCGYHRVAGPGLGGQLLGEGVLEPLPVPFPAPRDTWASAGRRCPRARTRTVRSPIISYGRSSPRTAERTSPRRAVARTASISAAKPAYYIVATALDIASGRRARHTASPALTWFQTLGNVVG